jgi:hypothetical protein
MIDNLTINQTKSMRYKTIDPKNCTFPELRSLELSSIENFNTIKDAFDAVDSLHHLKLNEVNFKDSKEILFRQQVLRSLALEEIFVESFELKNWNIEKLVLKKLMFKNEEALQTFTNFIKSLSLISELEIGLVDDYRQEYTKNYKEILEHLLNLPSLLKLKWHSATTANLKIHNPSVKSFFVDTGYYSANYFQNFPHFPDIETLEFSKFGWNFDSLSAAMNSLVNLKELKFEKITSDLLKAIDCPQLQKISIDGYIWCEDNKVWKQFVERHPNIEYLELTLTECNDLEPHFIKYFKNFAKLKTLKYHDFVDKCNCKTCNGIWLYNIIGHYFSGLEHLEIVVREEIVEKAVAYLRKKFPHLRCDTRKIQNLEKVSGYGSEGKKRALDHLITLRKI